MSSATSGARSGGGARDIPFQAQRAAWDAIAASPQFRRLTAAKKAFIVPAIVFFFAYCLALPALDGYAPHFMAAKVIGAMSRAYLLTLSQFVVTWLIAWRYVKAAGKFDKLAKDITVQAEKRQGEK
jgi:uncharacterized membrane protein (DUF485 family)